MSAEHGGSYSVDGAVRDGRYVVTLASPAGATASFLPYVGMLGTSFTLDGDEYLAVDDAGGVAGYETGTSMCGVPLLHPWANRLRHLPDDAVAPRSPALRRDDGGLPIHGLGAASPHWRVTAVHADTQRAVLRATFDSAAVDGFDACFPYPYALAYDAVLHDTTLSLTLTLTADGDQPVPVAFGFHPYLRLPDVPRAHWVLRAPVRTRVECDDRMLPTGARVPATDIDGPLCDRVFDDLYCDVHDADDYVLAGGGHRVTVSFDHGWTHAVVWAPHDPVTVCYEPMTASIDPFDGPFPCRTVRPGDAYTASFSISAARRD